MYKCLKLKILLIKKSKMLLFQTLNVNYTRPSPFQNNTRTEVVHWLLA